jgi:hypothetical protein
MQTTLNAENQTLDSTYRLTGVSEKILQNWNLKPDTQADKTPE